MALFAGCGPAKVDNSTPVGAYEGYRTAMRSGSWIDVYPLLMPEIRDKIARTWDLNRRTTLLVESGIPPALRMNYLADIGPEEVRKAASPAQYFSATLRSARAVSDDAGSFVSTKVAGKKETPRGSGNWEIRTLGGERIRVQAGIDRMFYIVPDNSDAARINQALSDAEDRLIIVQKIVDNIAAVDRTVQQ